MWIHEPDLKKRPTNPIQQEVYWTHRKHVRHIYLQYIYIYIIYIVHTSPQRLLSWAPTCSLRVSAWSCMIHDSVLFCTVLVHSELTNRFVTLESDFLPRTRTSDPTPNITLPFILPWVLFFFGKKGTQPWNRWEFWQLAHCFSKQKNTNWKHPAWVEITCQRQQNKSRILVLQK